MLIVVASAIRRMGGKNYVRIKLSIIKFWGVHRRSCALSPIMQGKWRCGKHFYFQHISRRLCILLTGRDRDKVNNDDL